MMRLLLVLSIAGCGPAPNATLADLPGLVVNVVANREVDSDDDDQRTSSIDVHLYYDTDTFRSSHGGSCATLDTNIDAVFNGTSLHVTHAGADETDFDSCNQPYLETNLLLGTGDEGHLVLTDGTLTINAVYAAGAIAARIAKLTPNRSWSFASGEALVLTWSSTADLAQFPAAAISVDFTRADARGFLLDGVAHTATEIMFTLPSPSPIRGDGILDIVVGEAGAAFDSGNATACTGATRCTYEAIRGYQHAAHIE